MKRGIFHAMALVAVTAAGMAGGCEKQENAEQVDPRVDGLTPPAKVVDPTIFEDQRELHKKMVAIAPPPPPPATAAATAPTPEGATTAPGEAPPAVPETTPPSPDTPPPPPPTQ